MTSEPFRIIIVGGGLSGLTLANCLERANIDYVLLEAYSELTPFVGAGLCLNAGSAPLMEQLGVRKELFDKITPLQYTGMHLPDGDYLGVPQPVMPLTDKRCGYTRGFIERSEILKVMYKNLPEESRKNKILPSKRIERIDHTRDGVTVHCTDGSTYHGDIVAGADGVKSKVRSEMWRASNATDQRVPQSEQQPAKATFSCLFGISNSLHDLGFHPRHFDLIPDDGHCILWMTNEDKIFWYVQKTLPKPIPAGEYKFTDADVEKMAADLADCPVMPNARATFKDLWDSRTTAVLLPTEMGEHKTVAWNRFALLGDSVHKQTISAGQGGNLCMESAAALTNVIKHLLDETRGRKPTVEEIDSALVHKYMEPRASRVAAYVERVNGHTSLICKYGLPLRIVQEYVLPILPSDAAGSFFSDLEVGADMLDFIPPPKAALSGHMPFNKLLGAGQRESLLSRAKWALPLIGLFILARKQMDASNGGAELLKLLEAGKITGGGQEVEIFSSFYGVKALDELLKVVTTFCAGWTPGFDTKSYWQVLTFFPDYGLATALMYLESYRSANTLTLAKLPMIWATLGQICGIGWAGQLYFFFHYLSSQMDNFKALDLRTTDLQYTRTLLPAMLTSFYAPFYLSMNPLSSFKTRYYWTWIWQPFPIWVWVIQKAIAKSGLSKSSLYDDRLYAPNRDLPTIRRTIYVLSGISAATWLYTLYKAPFNAFREFIPSWTAPKSGIWDVARHFIAWDHVLGFAGGYTWLALMFKDLKKWEKTDASWFKIGGAATLSTLVAGPGATLGLGWLWREELLATKRCKGALLEGTWEAQHGKANGRAKSGVSLSEKH